MVHKSNKMHIFKRDDSKEEVHMDKITSRIQKLYYRLNMDFLDPIVITVKVINGLYSGVTTQELDNMAAETVATLTTEQADYAVLATRLAVSNLHKETKNHFSELMQDLYNMKNEYPKTKSPMISDVHYKIIMDNADRHNSAIIFDRDFGYYYFGFKTLAFLC